MLEFLEGIAKPVDQKAAQSLGMMKMGRQDVRIVTVYLSNTWRWLEILFLQLLV